MVLFSGGLPPDPPGDPHQFEQKFNYRRPMYSILKYMWNTESYRESIKVMNAAFVSVAKDCCLGLHRPQMN